MSILKGATRARSPDPESLTLRGQRSRPVSTLLGTLSENKWQGWIGLAYTLTMGRLS